MISHRARWLHQCLIVLESPKSQVMSLTKAKHCLYLGWGYLRTCLRRCKCGLCHKDQASLLHCTHCSVWLAGWLLGW